MLNLIAIYFLLIHLLLEKGWIEFSTFANLTKTSIESMLWRANNKLLRMRDSYKRFVKTGESFENQSTKRIHETNLLKTWRIRDPRYETNPDSSITKRNESFKVRIRDPRYGTNPWIRETNPCFYESLIRTPQPYKKVCFVLICTHSCTNPATLIITQNHLPDYRYRRKMPDQIWGLFQMGLHPQLRDLRRDVLP